MKRITAKFFLFLLLLCSSQLSAQCEGWRAGLDVGPNFFLMHAYPGTPVSYEDERGFGVMFSADKQLGQRAHLGAGLGWTSLQFNGYYNWITDEPNDPALPVSGLYRLNYVDLTLRFSYDLLRKERWSAYAFAGGAGSLLIQSRTKVTNDEGEQRPVYLRRFLPGAEAGLGVSFRVNEKLELHLSPSFRYYFARPDMNLPGSLSMLQGRIGFRYLFGE